MSNSGPLTAPGAAPRSGPPARQSAAARFDPPDQPADRAPQGHIAAYYLGVNRAAANRAREALATSEPGVVLDDLLARLELTYREADERLRGSGAALVMGTAERQYTQGEGWSRG